MAPTFEYCAARFLDHWIRQEERHFLAFRKPTSLSVRAGLGYFKVSRGFNRIDTDPEVSSKVCSLLVTHSRYLSAGTAVARVESLASAIQNELSLANLLSASSKLLWLRCRSPVVIYDSRAIRALNKSGHRLKQRVYRPFHDAWHESFAAHRREIVVAADALPSIRQFTVASSRSKAQVVQIVQEDWFLERVFDQYLWIVGQPRNTAEELTYDA